MSTDQNPVTTIDEALDETLQGQDWEVLTKRLIAYARYRMCRVTSARNSGNAPEDYAQQSIVLFLEGTRRFSPGEGRTLFGFLCGVVDSLVSHDAEKSRRRDLDGAAEVSIGNDDAEESRVDQVNEEHLRADSFEPDVVSRDHFERFARRLDPRLRVYVRLLAEERYATAKECAAALGTTERAVRNMDRQLSRKRKLYDTCWHEHPHATTTHRAASA